MIHRVLQFDGDDVQFQPKDAPTVVSYLGMGRSLTCSHSSPCAKQDLFVLVALRDLPAKVHDDTIAVLAKICW